MRAHISKSALDLGASDTINKGFTDCMRCTPRSLTVTLRCMLKLWLKQKSWPENVGNSVALSVRKLKLEDYCILNDRMVPVYLKVHQGSVSHNNSENIDLVIVSIKVIFCVECLETTFKIRLRLHSSFFFQVNQQNAENHQFL